MFQACRWKGHHASNLSLRSGGECFYAECDADRPPRSPNRVSCAEAARLNLPISAVVQGPVGETIQTQRLSSFWRLAASRSPQRLVSVLYSCPPVLPERRADGSMVSRKSRTLPTSDLLMWNGGCYVVVYAPTWTSSGQNRKERILQGYPWLCLGYNYW